MGITDNLFTRKNSMVRPPVRPVTGQQRRLANYRKPDEPAQNTVTRYVFEERGLTASSARSNSSSGSLLARKIFEKPGYPKCICYRESCVITCMNLHCNWTGVGRVRQLCVLHPSVTFLLDLPQCPQCLCSLREIPDRPRPMVHNEEKEDI